MKSNVSHWKACRFSLNIVKTCAQTLKTIELKENTIAEEGIIITNTITLTAILATISYLQLLYFVIEELVILDLSWNKIGSRGANYAADTLRQNLALTIFYENIFVLELVSETLTTLGLARNQIADAAVKDLGNTLIINKRKQNQALSFLMIIDY